MRRPNREDRPAARVGDAVLFNPVQPEKDATPPELWRAHVSLRGIVERFISRGARKGWLVIVKAEHPLIAKHRGFPRRYRVPPENVLEIEIEQYNDWRKARGKAPFEIPPSRPRKKEEDGV